ncbi:MAG TPA: ATP-binding protein, partial [Anaerolineae bacterium]
MNPASQPFLQNRLSVLRWVLPFILGGLAVIYETMLGRWIHDAIGAYLYFDLDIVFYAIGLPLIVFLTLTLIMNGVIKAHRAQQLAQLSERRLGAIMAASADAILTLDGRGQIETWNRGAELLFGYAEPDIVGKVFTTLFGAGDSALVEFNWLSRIVQDAGFVRGHETTFTNSQGDQIAVELTATRLVDEVSQYLGMSVILRDVTERKHRVDEIRHLNATLSEQVALRTRELDEKVAQLARANAGLQALDQMRSEFVSLVSHQIRAPLTNMRGASERMRSDCAQLNPTCSRMFTILDQQSERLDRLVRDVLSTARIDAGGLVLQTEPISILPVINQVVDQIRTRVNDRPIRVPVKPGLPLAMADRDRVVEILTNLLDNADKYSPSNLEIVIDVKADESDVTLLVRDHGRGLADTDLDRLFNKFYRADGSDSQAVYGYGLGLYVCRQLVQAQGGR